MARGVPGIQALDVWVGDYVEATLARDDGSGWEIVVRSPVRDLRHDGLLMRHDERTARAALAAAHRELTARVKKLEHHASAGRPRRGAKRGARPETRGTA